MVTEKVYSKSRADKASYRMRNGSLPLKKRRYRLNFITSAPDSQIMTIDSSVNDENSDVNSSQSAPKTALSCHLPRSPSFPTCYQASEPASPCVSEGKFPENSSSANLPRLVTPLPNGCHWRTSRNKSYCRRRPCYNNSNFCKLHYQHYATISKSPADLVGNQEETVRAEVLKTTPGLPTLPNIMHQDKRFTETPGQVRCLATTTRGRPCAYVAVNETKYCYLHSQYEKSRPAPRRNSYTMALGAIGANPSSSSTSHAVLSSLPTGSWLNQSVVISTGPLQDRTGTVEKWGNGWVSVRVPGVGLHNRRSFELLLTRDQSKTLEDGSHSRPAQSIASSRVVTDSSASSSDESSSQDASTKRSISPVPTLIMADNKRAPQNIVSPQAA